MMIWCPVGLPLVAQWYRIHLWYRRLEFDPWVGKIHWRRKWQPTPVFLPAKSPAQRSLAGYSPWGHKELDTSEWLILSLYLFTFLGLSVFSWSQGVVYKCFSHIHQEEWKSLWTVKGLKGIPVPEAIKAKIYASTMLSLTG